MKHFVGAFVGIAIFFGFTFGIAFVGNYLDWWNTNYFAPKYEQTRYNTFKNGQAYNESMLHDIYNAKRQIAQAKSEDEKTAIKDYIRHQMQTFDKDKLPADLQPFYDQVMN